MLAKKLYWSFSFFISLFLLFSPAAAASETLQTDTLEIKDELSTMLCYLNGARVDRALLDKIDTNIIESINVLKGAAAKEKYGRKATTGVVEVNLKKYDMPAEPYNQEELSKSTQANDAAAEFLGGKKEFAKYMITNMMYPPSAAIKKVTGKVIVSYIIEPNGKLSNIKLEQGIGGGCNEAALNLIKNSPPWNPGLKNGRPVRTKATLPISFQLGT